MTHARALQAQHIGKLVEIKPMLYAAVRDAPRTELVRRLRAHADAALCGLVAGDDGRWCERVAQPERDHPDQPGTGHVPYRRDCRLRPESAGD